MAQLILYLTTLCVISNALFTLAFQPLSPVDPPASTPTCSGSGGKLILSLFWPSGYCAAINHKCKKKVPLPQRFTIHGMWSCKERKTTPKSTKKFVENLINDLKADLDQFWPQIETMKPDDNPGFWRSEWDKHGIYIKPEVHDYFQQIVNIVKQHNVIVTFQNAGFPNTVEKIAEAFGPNEKPFIICVNDGKGRSVLSEIYRCLDEKGGNFISCETIMKKKSTCPQGKKIYYD